MRMLKSLPAFLMCCLLISCFSPRKAVSVSKQHSDSLPPLPDSEIDFPIKVYANPLLARAEQAVPTTFSSDAWPDYLQPSCDFRYKYRFVRSSFNVSCINSRIDVQFTGSYQVAGSRCICSGGRPVSPWISGSCGFGKEPMRRVVIGISSRLDFLPSYQIRTNSAPGRIQALDKCQVSLFSSDITQLVLDSVKSSVAVFCSTLDETIAGMSFSGLTQQFRTLGYQKLNLGQYGFLLVNPKAIRIGQLNYAKDSFNIAIGLTCRPALSSDSSNSNPLPLLPPLAQTERAPGISLYLDAAYDYAFLSKLISDTLRNAVFDVKGRTIVIKNVELKGIDNHQIGIRVDFAGSNKGSIFLRGTPVLDTARQTLTMPDISYSLESGDLALKIARTLFRNKIRKTLEGRSYLDIGALVKSNLPLFDARLNRQLTKGIYSQGKTRDIRLIALLAEPQALRVQVWVKADLAVLSDGIF